MLTIHGITNAAEAAGYFCVDDYYAESGEPPGEWAGRGSAALGLNGQITREQFRAALEGMDPTTGTARVEGAGPRHRPGWDCTFSAPKTVSTCWAVATDADRTAIQTAHDRAVRAAIALMEREIATARRGHAGANHERAAGLVAAVYQHVTSRELEPQLHSHCIVANMASRQDGTWGGIDGAPLYHWKMALGAAYRAELAGELAQQGYQIEPDHETGSFQIAGVPDALCARWSTRSAQIDELADLHGTTTARGREIATLGTRKTKLEIDRDTLFSGWQTEGIEHGFSATEVAELRWAQIGREHSEELPVSDEQILAELTERRSILQRRDFFRATAVAEQARGGGLAVACARAEQLLEHPEVVRLRGADGAIVFTTREMLAIESGLRDSALARNAERRHTCPAGAAARAVSTRTLSDEQAAALNYLTRDSGGVAALVGDAGTGKSYLMGAAREAWQASGYRVRGCALAGKAAAGLEAGSGIRSQTLHSLLADCERQKIHLDQHDLIVVDEAGMIGSRQLADLIQRADSAGAKIVLIGDHKQLQPIDAGATFRHVAEATRAARLTEIRRQTNVADRQIVRDFARGEAALALGELKHTNRYHVADTADAAQSAMVAAWAVDRDPKNPESCLMIAGSRRDVFHLNRLARERVGHAGGLGFDHVLVLHVEGQERHLRLAEGDRVLFERNSKPYGVRNGELGTVTSLTVRGDGSALIDIQRDDGDRVQIDTTEYAHITHGYALTAHKSQGATVDRAHVFVSEGMPDREWSYVAMSRARDRTHLHIDATTATDLDRLMARSRQAESTLDYAPVSIEAGN